MMCPYMLFSMSVCNAGPMVENNSGKTRLDRVSQTASVRRGELYFFSFVIHMFSTN